MDSPTWNPESEQVTVTESFVWCQSMLWSLPAGGIPVAGHGLDHHDAQGEVLRNGCLIVKDRLASLGGTFGGEPSLLVFSEAVKLILGNGPGVFSWVADRALVAQVRLLEACINTPHLESFSV